MKDKRANSWLDVLGGKTLKSLRTKYQDDGTPYVRLSFTDETAYILGVKEGVFFEAACANMLRKATPVKAVRVHTWHGGCNTDVEIKADTFPLIVLRAVDKKKRYDFPFSLVEDK